MYGTLEVTVNVDDIIGDIETETLIEEICSRGGVAAGDWAGLFNDDSTLIGDILDAIRDESETGEIVEWLQKEGYTVANADDDVVVVKRSKIDSAVNFHVIDALSRIDEQMHELATALRKTVVKSSERAINGILSELNEGGEE